MNPFLFMTAILVEPYVNNDGSYTAVPGVPIIGQNVSSLHRLKDVDNKGACQVDSYYATTRFGEALAYLDGQMAAFLYLETFLCDE